MPTTLLTFRMIDRMVNNDCILVNDIYNARLRHLAQHEATLMAVNSYAGMNWLLAGESLHCPLGWTTNMNIFGPSWTSTPAGSKYGAEKCVLPIRIG